MAFIGFERFWSVNEKSKQKRQVGASNHTLQAHSLILGEHTSVSLTHTEGLDVTVVLDVAQFSAGTRVEH